MNQKLLESAINGVVEPNGFKKRGPNWFRQSSTVLQLVNLQKSQFGGQYFVNLCFVPVGMPIDGLPLPKEHKFPIRIRLTSALEANHEEVEALFDLEKGTFSDIEHCDRIRNIFSAIAMPILDQLTELDALKSAIKGGAFRRGTVNLKVREWLGIEES